MTWLNCLVTHTLTADWAGSLSHGERGGVRGYGLSIGSNPLTLTLSPSELGFTRVRHFIKWSKSETSNFDWRGNTPSSLHIHGVTSKLE